MWSGPIQPKSAMDSRNTFDLLGVLASSSVWNHVVRLVRPAILAPRHHCLE